MRKALSVAVLAASLVSGCGYFPVAPDPIRIVDSPTDVVACRRLGSVGGPVRTDGRGPFLYGQLTEAVPAGNPAARYPASTASGGLFDGLFASDNFALRLNAMRDAALSLGATDLLLSRRILRDWSYVEGIAYRCRR